MAKINPNETVNELRPAVDNEVTVIAEDTKGHSTEEFVSYEEIRRLINADADSSRLDQFSNIHNLGSGGIGSVHAVGDNILKREVAIKILRPMYRKRKRPVGRIVREAIVTAQIEHPNIVPVHSMGVLEDVGVYFTMKKVSGETLQEVLQKLEAGEKKYLTKYTPVRLLEIFIDICQGVAYAHSKGVIHRDLKPSNVMLGEYGEVMVMDWGLVKFKGEEDITDNFGVYSEEKGGKMLTLDGTIAGTPLFMSPEQASGLSAEVDEHSDIYSLGGLLYCILTYKQSPFKESHDLKDVLSQVANGAFVPPRKALPRRHVPRELNAICMKAMALKKNNRYATVIELVKDIRSYIEGYPVSAYRAPFHHRFLLFCGRNRVATTAVLIAMLTLVSYLFVTGISDGIEYNSYLKAAEYNSESADQARMRAYSLYRQLRRGDDANAEMGRTMEEKRLEGLLKFNKAIFENRYNMALFFYSKLEKMHKNDLNVTKGISDTFRKLFEYALLTDDLDDMTKIDALIRMRGRHIGYLKEDALKVYFKAKAMLSNKTTVKIETVPAGKEIQLWKIDPRDNETTLIKQGNSPLDEKNLSSGTYLAMVNNASGQTIRFPLMLEPGQAISVHLTTPENIPDNMVYIPAGEFIYGDDDNNPMHRTAAMVDAFFIKKYEVTFREYLVFWKTLDTPEKQDEYRAKNMTADRYFTNLWDSEGHLNQPYTEDMPVTGITRKAAEAFCCWKSAATGRTYRLPTAQEWEKAARGPDGRSFVWGNNIDYNAALTSGADKGILKRYPLYAAPGSFPKDVSIYGVFDMAGNVREYTANGITTTLHIIKGASRFTGPDFLYCWKTGCQIMYINDIGFRYILQP